MAETIPGGEGVVLKLMRCGFRQRMGFVLAVCGLAAASMGMEGGMVRKVAEPFEQATWNVIADSLAGGTVRLSSEVPADSAGASKNALEVEATFSGKGFETFAAGPGEPLMIPGRTKKLSLWVRNRSKFHWVLLLKDGWGRTEANGKKLEWPLTYGSDGNWKKVTFDVPADWVQPLSIVGVGTNNWDYRNEKTAARVMIDTLEIETDTADVDPTTGLLKGWQPPAAAVGQTAPKAPVTPLRSVTLRGSALHNVFSGEKPRFLLTARNWNPEAATGMLTWKVSDANGAAVLNGTQPLNVPDSLALNLAIDTPKYGLYRLESTVAWADGKKFTTAQPYAVIPVPKELSDAEKDASPYGINVHSGRLPMVSTFAKAGITWYRDYAFSLEWVLRAKGEDNQFAGWPFYRTIVRRYEDSKVRLLPVFQKSISPPNPGGKPGPGVTWTRDMATIMTAFPSLTALELDNEYDLHGGNAKMEDAIAWKNYGLFHKKFADIAGVINDGQTLMVENGRAGIWPERLRRMVLGGDFADIDVVNSHHYTGTDSPELNVGNHNMGFAGDESVLCFYDQLRAAKKAASADGKPRQHWLTEFGWDTKAGPKVSHREQAAYLARAYMLLAASGTEKGFWFFDLDSPDANTFFDGCGLFDHEQMPKLSYVAFAGLTQILPKAQYIGMINAGENTWGYLFRNEGKLVAALWTMDGKKGPTVDFGGATVYDYFANPLGKSSAALGMEPVYAVGVFEDSKWAKQAAYSIESPILMTATAGDTMMVELKVTNTRTTPISGKARLQLPAGWSDASGETTVSVAPGQSATFPLKYRISATETLGEKWFRVAISEGEPLHTIPLRAQIGRPILMTVQSLGVTPGESEVTIRLSNRSAQPLNGKLNFNLPSSWKTAMPSLSVDDLKPMEVRDIRAKVNWSPEWKEGEAASVQYVSVDGRSVQQPLIPGRLTIYPAPNVTMDGSLKDWSAKNRIPAWALGSTLGEPNAAIYLGWSDKGLHVALDVKDSKADVPDPRNFWVGDVLELFVDTRANKTRRRYEVGDHQFWLAPQVGRKRVYVGQWKRNNEIPATQYDIPNIQSASVKTQDGYTIECLIPAALIQGYKPVAGTQLGLNLNLSLKGVKLDREVFWPVLKSEGADQPATWGTVVLGP